MRRHGKDDAVEAELLQRIDELDETTFLGFNKFRSARDQLPVFKAS
jgi:hypothetical protein